MEIVNLNFSVNTISKSLNDITNEVYDYVQKSKITNGLCTLFIKHTSASLVIQENADPAVLRDIESFFTKLDKIFASKPSGDPDKFIIFLEKLFINFVKKII